MKGLALDKLSSLILVLVGVAVGIGIISQLLTGSSFNIADIFDSNVDQCPENRGFDNLTFQELKERSSDMFELGCNDKLANITFVERISRDRLERLAEDEGLESGGEPLYSVYPGCDPPEGIKGVVTNTDERLVVDKTDRVNLSWSGESLKICVG